MKSIEQQILDLEDESAIRPFVARFADAAAVWILFDNVGNGATTSFDSLIETPTFDKLVNRRLRYTNGMTKNYFR